MVARTLITTADESTWPKDKNEPVLFLGEWCRLYGRREKWQPLDSKTVPYHWDDRNKLHADYIYIQDSYESILKELSLKLNQLHQVDHSLKYWRILIGPWLGYFMQMLFDRWYMLKYALENYNVSTVYLARHRILVAAPNDMGEFNQMYVGDQCNAIIYAQLLTLCWGDSVRTEFVEIANNKEETKKPKNRSFVNRFIKTILNKTTNLLSKDNDVFFISTYLPAKTEALLQIKLGQLPKFRFILTTDKCEPNHNWRKWQLTSEETTASFEDVIRKIIPLHIPTAYLEGYGLLVQKPNHNRWPQTPKLIFTSNAFCSDDVFKAWAASKVEEQATPLVIGQHGGHFGMNPFAFHEEHQIEISDAWLSWGWSDINRPQIKPIGNLKRVGRNLSHNPSGNALMVEMTMPRYSYHLYAAPIAGQWLNYYEQQTTLLRNLPKEIKNKITLRLYHNDYGWQQSARWTDESLSAQIDHGIQNIRDLVQQSRLYISTYNATTYLESFAWNVPTIMFWNLEHWELNSEAKPYFDLLQKAGVFHTTPESAAEQITKIWDDVDSWWLSQPVQDAVKQFSWQYSRNDGEELNRIHDLFKSLMENKSADISH